MTVKAMCLHINVAELNTLSVEKGITVKPRYNAVSGRHLLKPRYKRGAL